MDKEILERFERECLVYLSQYDIYQLRAYGRNIGVKEPTKKLRKPLLDAILGVLSGRIAPVERSIRGAPVKSDFFDPKIPDEIEKIRVSANAGFPETARESEEKRDIVKEIAEFKATNKLTMVFNSPNYTDKSLKRCGQLTTLDGVSYVLPLSCRDNGEKVVMPVELIREYDLKEGDIVSCQVEKAKSVFIVVKILTVNGFEADKHHRFGDFDDMSASYPTQPVRFFHPAYTASVTAKYLDWLFNIGKGQRCRILSAPKAGKTELIYELVKGASLSNADATVCVLLIEQSPETISRFRGLVDADSLVYSTYDDTPERQVFTAEFLLKRAKRLAECGKDVILFVDSFNALARAYNDTALSSGGKMLSCGLESKTVQYIKKYFGCARNLEKGGSVTIIGTVSCDSGIPIDDCIATELSAITNADIFLNEKLAVQRIYPAVDLTRSKTWNGVEKFDNAETLRRKVVDNFLPQFGEQALRDTLYESTAYDIFLEKIFNA